MRAQQENKGQTITKQWKTRATQQAQHKNIISLIWLNYYFVRLFFYFPNCFWSLSWRGDLDPIGINPSTSVLGSRIFYTLYRWHLIGVTVGYSTTCSTAVPLYVRLVPRRICTGWLVLTSVHPTWGWNYLIELLIIMRTFRVYPCNIIYFVPLPESGFNTII